MPAETQLWKYDVSDVARKGVCGSLGGGAGAAECRCWKLASTLAGEAKFPKQDLDGAAWEQSEG